MTTSKKELKIDKLNDDEVDPGVLSRISSVSDILSQFTSRVDTMASRLDEVEVKINTLTASISALSASASAPPVGEFTHKFDDRTEPTGPSVPPVPPVPPVPKNVIEETEGTEGTEGTERTEAESKPGMNFLSSPSSPSVESGHEISFDKEINSHVLKRASEEPVNLSGSESDESGTEDISVVSLQTVDDSVRDGDDAVKDNERTIITTTPYYNDPILTCEDNICHISLPSTIGTGGTGGTGHLQVTVDVLKPEKFGYIYLWSPQDELPKYHDKPINELLKKASNITTSLSKGHYDIRTTAKLLSLGKVKCIFHRDTLQVSESPQTLSFTINYTF